MINCTCLLKEGELYNGRKKQQNTTSLKEQ